MSSARRPTLSGKRFSASGEASRQGEKDRVLRMTPLERMALALALGRRQKLLQARGREGDTR